MSRWFAPGKVVLLGEYAVLDGAPALVAAVSQGVRCTVRPSPELIIETPGTNDRFVRPALTAARAPAARYRFEAHPPLEGPKLGLGSSAAATVVAVLTALSQRGPTPSAEALHALAYRVHREVQGSGSGLDIAASSHGGVIQVQSGEVRPQPLPALPIEIIATGHPASTGPRVERYLRWADRSDFVRQSIEIADLFATEPVHALRCAGELLVSMARTTGIDYLTAELAEISAIAESCGGAAKPSGAGGGDIAVAVLPDPQARATFRARCADRGLPPLDLTIAPGARRLDSEPRP